MSTHSPEQRTANHSTVGGLRFVAPAGTAPRPAGRQDRRAPGLPARPLVDRRHHRAPARPWHAIARFRGTPGRYPVRLRIRREALFPYELGYSPAITVTVRCTVAELGTFAACGDCVLALLRLVPAAPASAGTYDVTTCSTRRARAASTTRGSPDRSAGSTSVLRSRTTLGLVRRRRQLRDGRTRDQSGGGTIGCVMGNRSRRSTCGPGRHADREACALARRVGPADANGRALGYGRIARRRLGAWRPVRPGPVQARLRLSEPVRDRRAGIRREHRQSLRPRDRALHLGLECGTDNGTIAGCDTAGPPSGYFRLKARSVTIRDDVAAALEATGRFSTMAGKAPTLTRLWSASDNTGIRTRARCSTAASAVADDLAATTTCPSRARTRRAGLGLERAVADGQARGQVRRRGLPPATRRPVLERSTSTARAGGRRFAGEREDDHRLGERRRVGRGGRDDLGAQLAVGAVPRAADDARQRPA